MNDESDLVMVDEPVTGFFTTDPESLAEARVESAWTANPTAREYVETGHIDVTRAYVKDPVRARKVKAQRRARNKAGARARARNR